MNKMSTVRVEQRLPVVLSAEEVKRLIHAAPGLKYQAAFALGYGAGLRAGEVVGVKILDIDRERKAIRVEQGKGRKDRYARLSPTLHKLLRAEVTATLARRAGCFQTAGCFRVSIRLTPLSTRQLNRAFHAALELAEINKTRGRHWR